MLVSKAQSVSKGDSSNVSNLVFGSHTGTHVDAPSHIFDGEMTVDKLPLDLLMGRASVVAFPEDVFAIGYAELRAQGVELLEAQMRKRILLKTRNSDFLEGRSPFRPDYTFLAPDGAEYLIDLGVQLVGVDYLSIEQFHSGHHKTHKMLLSNNIVIAEGLNLSNITAGEYEFCCLPLRIEGCDGAPARAVLIDI